MSLRTVFGVLLFVAGCCRGTGAAHKCDFTPPDVPGADAGTDGPLPCGQEICAEDKVCCVLKSPPAAFCVSPENFVTLGCEELEIPCFKPSDCPDSRLTCCVRTVGQNASVSCVPQVTCIGEGTYVACSTEADCPFTSPSCNNFGETPDGEPFNVCGPRLFTPAP